LVPSPGPVGTATGVAAGAIAGGLAGKGIGELIDPTTEDNWLRDNMPWTKAKEAVKDAYDRNVQLRKERCYTEDTGASAPKA
jgi:hypothetical protein